MRGENKRKRGRFYDVHLDFPGPCRPALGVMGKVLSCAKLPDGDYTLVGGDVVKLYE